MSQEQLRKKGIKEKRIKKNCQKWDSINGRFLDGPFNTYTHTHARMDSE